MDPAERDVMIRALGTHKRETYRVVVTEDELLPEEAKDSLLKEHETTVRLRDGLVKERYLERLADSGR